MIKEMDQSKKYCEVCGQGGELVLCNVCTCAYHSLGCLGTKVQDLSSPYTCPKCTGDLPAIKRAHEMCRADCRTLTPVEEEGKGNQTSYSPAAGVHIPLQSDAVPTVVLEDLQQEDLSLQQDVSTRSPMQQDVSTHSPMLAVANSIIQYDGVVEKPVPVFQSTGVCRECNGSGCLICAPGEMNVLLSEVSQEMEPRSTVVLPSAILTPPKTPLCQFCERCGQINKSLADSCSKCGASMIDEGVCVCLCENEYARVNARCKFPLTR